MVIETPRMRLRSATRAMLIADLDGGLAGLAHELHAIVPENWPPPLYDEAAIAWTIERVTAGEPDEFLLYYWLLKTGAAPIAIGLGGFKGTPVDGRIEVGYALLEQYHRQGLASEGVAALVQFAFRHADIDEVFAETLPELIASIGVLEKNDFELLGPGSGDGIIQFGLKRAKWQALGVA